MTPALSVITIGVDPTIELGPVTLGWHGIAISAGMVIGALAGRRYARELGLDLERLSTVGLLLVLFGILGARILYLAESGDVARPGEWIGTRGFALNGGVILAGLAIAAYLRRGGFSPRYLDAVAVGFPLGLAVGRIGDVINGEHYGPSSDSLLAVQNTHPDADVPSTAIAYHSGGLYELLLAAAILAIAWPLRHRLRRPTMLLWAVAALYAGGRFVEFFFRLDSPGLALGLNAAQWTSVALLAIAGLGALWAVRRYGTAEPHPRGWSRESPARAA